MCHAAGMLADDNLLTFTEKRAAEIANVSLGRLMYWDFKDVVRPGIRRRLGRRSTVKLYDFEDTVALLVVAQLRSEGASLQHVRKIVEHLRSRGYERPLTDLVFATLGPNVYFQHPDGSWEGGANPDQLVIRHVLDLKLMGAKVRAGAGRQASEIGQIERRPKTMGHKLVFAGTRIPVETVVRWLDHGRTPEQIIEAYPDLLPADIEAARGYVVSA
jgi:uncharacterized protein (DUF433 family)